MFGDGFLHPAECVSPGWLGRGRRCETSTCRNWSYHWFFFYKWSIWKMTFVVVVVVVGWSGGWLMFILDYCYVFTLFRFFWAIWDARTPTMLPRGGLSVSHPNPWIQFIPVPHWQRVSLGEKHQPTKLGGGNSNIFYFHPYLGRWSNLTSIFFKWVETTNQQKQRRRKQVIKTDIETIWILQHLGEFELQANSINTADVLPHSHWCSRVLKKANGKLTSNLNITCLNRKIIFQTLVFGFRVNIQWCT